ncbi:MAG: DUF58 domain-containing protein, partial [Chloroflexi bacterium]|nr:DUF58 domain-containing protein [Chloroflexota bacterium]
LDFGTANCEKRDLAVAAAAAVGFLTARSGNRLGAVLLGAGDRAPITVPARTGRLHLQALLHKVITAPRGDGGGATDLAAGIGRLATIARRRGLAVVVSDFLADPAWERPLRRLSTRHDVLAVEVVDPRELELPNVGLLAVVDPESGAQREVHTGSPALRARYAAAAAAQRATIARALLSAGCDHLVLRTDRDWLADLVRFVAMRPKRLEAMARARP